MPCISQFFGIVIYMYYNDHTPPQFHDQYGGDEARYMKSKLCEFMPDDFSVGRTI